MRRATFGALTALLCMTKASADVKTKRELQGAWIRTPTTCCESLTYQDCPPDAIEEAVDETGDWSPVPETRYVFKQPGTYRLQPNQGARYRIGSDEFACWTADVDGVIIDTTDAGIQITGSQSVLVLGEVGNPNRITITSTDNNDPAINVADNGAALTAYNVDFQDCRGGAVDTGGGPQVNNYFKDCTFTGNTRTGIGGAVQGSAQTSIFAGATYFAGNSATGSGNNRNGGAVGASGTGRFYFCDSTTFDGNEAPNGDGGAFSVQGNWYTRFCGCTTFTNNVANNGGAMVFSGSTDTEFTTTSQLTVLNNRHHW